MVKDLKMMLEEISTPLFDTEWGRRAALGALVLTAGLGLYTLMNVGSDWRENFRGVEGGSSRGSEQDVIRLVGQIPAQHLFGEYGVAEKSTHLPITSLQIQLTGIINAKPESASRVIISEGGKPGKIYQVGDTLESGVRVYAVTQDSIILDNGGQLEKLPLRHNVESGSGQKAKEAAPVLKQEKPDAHVPSDEEP